MSLQSHARVVIIGGGSLGVNLMYHLTEEGWTDVVMIKKGNSLAGPHGTLRAYALTLTAITPYLKYTITPLNCMTKLYLPKLDYHPRSTSVAA